MTTAARARSFLAPVALTFALAGASACAKTQEGTAQSQTDDQAASKAKSGGPAPIAGKPVEGGGKVATVPGEGQDSRPYEVEIDAGTAAVGEQGKVTIKVVPDETWHVNLEYPTALTVEAPDGVEIAKPEQGKADALALTEQTCEFAVTYTPREAGDKAFRGELRFAICQDTACVPKSEAIAFEVAVE